MVEKTRFGTLEDGTEVSLYRIGNASSAGIAVTDLGAAIVSVEVPDRDGELADVALGFESPALYRSSTTYFGAVPGRYANRIARGRFDLCGETHQLPINDAPNSLHGGTDGFSRRMWAAEAVRTGEGEALRLTLVSPDGDQGYPGRMEASVTYGWSADNRLTVDYCATSDRATVVNLTQHSYWNLAGAASGDVLGHVLTLDADFYTPVDPTLIPTGEIRSVEGTPFDFTSAKPIGRDIGAADEQLRIAGGYDHNFVLRRAALAGELARAAVLRDPGSGRTLTVHTTEPGVQLYSGNFLNGETGKGQAVYGKHQGVALETQHFPDSPNQPHFPRTTLKPGETWRSRTVFAFGTD